MGAGFAMGNPALGNFVGAIAARPEEAAILAELKAGSEEAFNWLIDQYHAPIYGVILRTLQDPADAADLTQDVFLKVFRGIRGFNGESSLKTWIYRIALHEASNQRRWWSRHKRQEITIESESDDHDEESSQCLKDTLMDGHESPFDLAAQSEVRARVEQGLREVPEPFRTVVVLRDIQGLAYEEIAEILETQLGTVKSRLTRGRAALKERLTAYAAAAQLSGAQLASARCGESKKQVGSGREPVLTHAGQPMEGK